MKNYSKWSNECKGISDYEDARKKVSKLSESQIIELMDVANFISSRTFYGIISNVVAIIAMVLSLVEPMSLCAIIGIVILILIIILIIRGWVFNSKMVNGANLALWAIHDRNSRLEVKEN